MKSHVLLISLWSPAIQHLYDPVPQIKQYWLQRVIPKLLFKFDFSKKVAIKGVRATLF